MATATRKVQVPSSRGGTRAVSETAAVEFLIYRANSGDYHWELVDDSDERLVQSGSFTSQVEAERGALHVYEGIRSAPFAPRVTDAPPTAAV